MSHRQGGYLPIMSVNVLEETTLHLLELGENREPARSTSKKDHGPTVTTGVLLCAVPMLT